MGKTHMRDAQIRTTTFYKSTRKACDLCRLRKVRCCGSQPCDSCLQRSTRCTYLHVPKKKGPRRDTQKHHCSCPNAEEMGSDRGSESDSCSLASQANTETNMSPDSGPPQYESELDIQEEISIATEHTGFSIPFVAEADTDERVDRDRQDNANATLANATDRFPTMFFYRYVQLFFAHLYPIMPILDPGLFLDMNFFLRPDPLTSDEYCLVAALSAITIVQLNLTASPGEGVPTVLQPEVLIQQCLQERARNDGFLEEPTTGTIITSFFLFGYYGNMEMHSKSRYYLLQAITFAEMINLGDETVNDRLSEGIRQWRLRIFWLLFITERAYALQCRTQVKILKPTVPLPKVFDSDNPRLLYGFVALVNLFHAIDNTFMAFWSCTDKDKRACTGSWLKSLQYNVDTSTLLVSESMETQRLDISVSRLWLHILLWQMGVTCGLVALDASDQFMNLGYPVKLAKELVTITSKADQNCLNSHGIGMEQKLSDIGHCLVDVLKLTSTRLQNSRYAGSQYLASIIQLLSHIRGRESHYLQPLLLRAKPLFTYPTRALNLPAPVVMPAPSERLEKQELYRLDDDNQLEQVVNMSTSGRSGVLGGTVDWGTFFRDPSSIDQELGGF